MKWCIISIGLAVAHATDETFLMQMFAQSRVQGLSDESRIASVLDKVGHSQCVPVLAGERAPMIGSFSSNDGQIQNAPVAVGQIAPKPGSFCVETASLALLQRSSASVLDKVGHAQCVPVLAGERAPTIGSFSSNDGQIQNAPVAVGQIAPKPGSFCVETASLALLQRSSRSTKIADIEHAVSAKNTPETSNSGGTEKAVQAKNTPETSNSGGTEKAVQGKFGSAPTPKPVFKCPSVGGQSLLQGPFSIIPGFEQATQTAQTAINAATKATTIVGKLAELAKATAAATVASTAGAVAVQTLGTNIVSITQTINNLGLQTLFDGRWSTQDLVVLTKFDDYVKITDRILASTRELETVACSFHAIVAIQTSIIDILNSAKELAPVLGDLKIAEFEKFSNQSTSVAEQSVEKASEISSADRDLRPGLEAYTSGNPAQQVTVLLTHGVAFERGFTNLGKAWQEVKKFQDEKVKPLIDGINPLVSKLNSNVINFNPLR